MKKGDPGYWEWRKNVGKPKKIANPKKLWALACDYFESVDSRPFLKQEQRRAPVKIEKGAVITDEMLAEIKKPVVELETIRPYSWAGFSDYLFEKGVIYDIYDYRYNLDNRYSEYKAIVKAIDRVMFSQKFDGAAVGAFNSSIISTELGLASKSEIKVVEEQPLFADDPNADEGEG